MINRTITIILFAWGVFISAQEKASIHEQRMDSFIQYVKMDKTLNTYIIYNIDKKYLVINKVGLNYEYYWYNESFDYEKQRKKYNLSKQIKECKEKLLDDLFNDKCKSYNVMDYVDGSSYVYFTKYIDGEKNCDFFMPYMYYNKHKTSFPIKNKYMRFLTEKILNL